MILALQLCEMSQRRKARWRLWEPLYLLQLFLKLFQNKKLGEKSSGDKQKGTHFVFFIINNNMIWWLVWTRHYSNSVHILIYLNLTALEVLSTIAISIFQTLKLRGGKKHSQDHSAKKMPVLSTTTWGDSLAH